MKTGKVIIICAGSLLLLGVTGYALNKSIKAKKNNNSYQIGTDLSGNPVIVYISEQAVKNGEVMVGNPQISTTPNTIDQSFTYNNWFTWY